MAKERKASVIYEGNASQLIYAFPFDYLRKKFVKVEDIYTNITELTIGVDYTVEDKQVRLVKGIPLGHSVKIYRETTTAPLVEWQDASVLRSADLSLQEVQLLHLAEETGDRVFDSGMSTAYDNPNCWDGQYKRIINALDPIEDGDVVTLRYIKANQDSLLNKIKNTGETQNKRLTDTGNSQNARLIATGDAQNKKIGTTGNTQNTRLTNTGTNYVNAMKAIEENAKTWDPTYYLGAKPEIRGDESSPSALTIPFKQGIYDINYGYPSGLPDSTYKFSLVANLMGQDRNGILLSLFATDAHGGGAYPELFYRTGFNNTWREWHKLVTPRDIPTKTSQLTNDSGYVRLSQMAGHSPKFDGTEFLGIAPDGVTEAGQYIDMHQKGTAEDYTVRLSCDGGSLKVTSKTGHLILNESELWIE